MKAGTRHPPRRSPARRRDRLADDINDDGDLIGGYNFEGNACFGIPVHGH
jgi:hypothetical protein